MTLKKVEFNMSDKEYLENTIRECLKESVDEYLDTDYEGYKKISNDTANSFWNWYSKNKDDYQFGIAPGNSIAPNGDNIIVYHSTNPENVPGIAENGFTREFNSDSTGSYNGSGIYTTLTPSQQTKGYGKAIVKCLLVGGLKDFIIFPREIRRAFRGKDITLQQEIENIIRKDPDTTISSSGWGEHDAHRFFSHYRGKSLYDDRGRRKYNNLEYDEIPLNKAGIRGFVYYDGHGLVVLVRDFNSLIPYQVVMNRSTFDISHWGSNWKFLMNNEDNFNTINNNIDVYYKFSGKYPKTHPLEKAHFGYALVGDGNGYNYVDAKTGDEVLPVPANEAYPFGPDRKATFVINGKEHKAVITPNGDIRFFYSGSNIPLKKEMFARKVEMDKNNR